MDFVYDQEPWALGTHWACAAISLVCLPFAAYYGALIKHRLAFMTVKKHASCKVLMCGGFGL